MGARQVRAAQTVRAWGSRAAPLTRGSSGEGGRSRRALAVLPPFARLLGHQEIRPEARVPCAGVGAGASRRVSESPPAPHPAPARPSGRARSRPGRRGGRRAGARGAGRGAGGAGTCSPRAAASPGRPRRGPGRGLRLPPGAAAQRMSPARLRRVYYAAGAGEPKRSRPRGPGGDGRWSRRGQVRLSFASLRERGGGRRGRRRAGRAGERGPVRPAQAAGAAGEPGTRAAVSAAAFVRGHDATKRGGGPGSRRRRGPLPSALRPRPPGRPRPGLGGVAAAGARSLELARPARPAPATSRAPSLTERIFSPFPPPAIFRRGDRGGRGGEGSASAPLCPRAPGPPRSLAAGLARGLSPRLGRGARPAARRGGRCLQS